MWIVGIDEAGYGPNLGPLLQAAVALHLPDDDPAGWGALKSLVRRTHEKADGRLLIDDSKKVYGRGGLEALERGVFCGLARSFLRLSEIVESLILESQRGELAEEAWYDGGHPLPCESWERFETALPEFTPVVSLVPSPRFNRICDEFDSKGAVLARGVIELMPAALIAISDDGHPISFVCDKQGGRNFYAAMLQQAFPDGWVVVERESAAESRYRIDGLDRPISVVFRPRADGDSVCVALASMLCKYLREVCMKQFNAFWSKHVPGIAPTAGYPGDSRRFYEQIKPAMAKLGLSEDQVWRKR
jgi:ribonuclease HII